MARWSAPWSSWAARHSREQRRHYAARPGARRPARGVESHGGRKRIGQTFAGIERLSAADIADAIAYIVTRPRHVAVNEMLVRPTEQER